MAEQDKLKLESIPCYDMSEHSIEERNNHIEQSTSDKLRISKPEPLNTIMLKGNGQNVKGGAYSQQESVKGNLESLKFNYYNNFKKIGAPD